jgi:hypothetical protein
VRIIRNICNGEVWCFLRGTDWILKYYLYVLRLQRVNNELERIWKEAVVAWFDSILPFAWRDWWQTRNSSVRIAGLRADLPNTKECQQLGLDVRSKFVMQLVSSYTTRVPSSFSVVTSAKYLRFSTSLEESVPLQGLPDYLASCQLSRPQASRHRGDSYTV